MSLGFCIDCPRLGGTAARSQCCMAENDAVVNVIEGTMVHSYRRSDFDLLLPPPPPPPQNRKAARRAAALARKARK